MMIFALGITMVVAVTFTMEDLSNSIYNTSAESEANSMLGRVREKMLEVVSEVGHWAGSGEYRASLNLPDSLARQFNYEIAVVQDEGHYMLQVTTTSYGSEVDIREHLVVETVGYSISGSIRNTLSDPFLLVEWENGAVTTVIIGNQGA